jgi:hypothetical protein
MYFSNSLPSPATDLSVGQTVGRVSSTQTASRRMRIGQSFRRLALAYCTSFFECVGRGYKHQGHGLVFSPATKRQLPPEPPSSTFNPTM